MKKTLFALLLCASSASAQSARITETAEIVQARTAIALAAGNPLPGASSTLGMRIGKIPRVSAALRMTGVYLDIPDIRTTNTNDNSTALPRSVNVDAAVGIYSGMTLAPTLGGFASLDILASAGRVGLPDSDGFDTDPSSWAVGARLGILRESFTVPGVAVSAMYRHIGDMHYGNGTTTNQFQLRDNSVTSFRATVGKRLFVFGATAGVGIDKLSSNLDKSFNPGSGLPLVVSSGSFDNTRKTVFLDATWTMLVLNFVAEGGMQTGGDNTGYYGSLAARIVL